MMKGDNLMEQLSHALHSIPQQRAYVPSHDVFRRGDADVHPRPPEQFELDDVRRDRMIDPRPPAGLPGEGADALIDKAAGEPAVTLVRRRLAGVELEIDKDRVPGFGHRIRAPGGEYLLYVLKLATRPDPPGPSVRRSLGSDPIVGQ
jgi:hypothetical protein